MTSFKSAQLIASSKAADKVIFLMDRIELGTQSLKEYRGFADENESVQETESTQILITKLKSANPTDSLIVTSIQKMSRIKDEEDGLHANDIKSINSKRIVFIVDECHRSTFGDMLINIKDTFPRAVFFGFTGTPILDENQKKLNTTSTVFGDELHRYSIADGIRDKNILGFDLYKVSTFKEKTIRREIALNQAKAKSEEEIFKDEKKIEIYEKFTKKLKMYGYTDENENYIKGIEDYIPNSQYETKQHREAVVGDILENWTTQSWNREFSAILATSSINEAIEYYNLFKEKEEAKELNITVLFDPNIDNNEGFEFKEEALVNIIKDYNKMYNQTFSMKTFDKMRKDIASRLAHKKPYKMINKNEQIDLMIVVDQMLTGYDSKWINTIYLDKVLKYENIIQAFSRTNRIYGEHKHFGTIKYYRRPNTMEKYIEKAVKLYSGDKPVDLFVEKLDENIKNMNKIFKEIKDLFKNAKIYNFETNPTEKNERVKFATLYNQLHKYLDAAKIQGFRWEKSNYKFEDKIVKMKCDYETYQIISLRYSELYKKTKTEKNNGTEIPEVPYIIEGYITEINTNKIDNNYMNTRFEKYYRTLKQDKISKEELNKTLNELYKSFASLTQEEQKYANIFLHDIQSGNISIEEGKSFREYINKYQIDDKNKQIEKLANILGINKLKLKRLMNLKVTERNLNEYGRFDELINTIDKTKAKLYFEKLENKSISDFKVNVKIHNLLREFIISGGFDIE